MTAGTWRLAVLAATVLAGPLAGGWVLARWCLAPDLAGAVSMADWGARTFLQAFDVAALLLTPPVALAVRVAARRLSPR